MVCPAGEPMYREGYVNLIATYSYLLTSILVCIIPCRRKEGGRAHVVTRSADSEQAPGVSTNVFVRGFRSG